MDFDQDQSTRNKSETGGGIAGECKKAREKLTFINRLGEFWPDPVAGSED